MRNQETGAALHQVLHRFHDDGLGFQIHRAGRLIEDQDGSIFKKGAGKRDALTLSAREANTALADLSLVTRGQILDELVDVRRLRRGNNFLHAGSGPGVGDVFRDAAGKKNGVLGNNGGLIAQVRQFVIAKVRPVEKNAPFRRIVETQQKINECRLPRPRRSGDTNSHARLDLE